MKRQPPVKLRGPELNPDILHITLAVQYSLLATSFTHSMWKAGAWQLNNFTMNCLLKCLISLVVHSLTGKLDIQIMHASNYYLW